MPDIPLARFIRWLVGRNTAPFDCITCGRHVESGERVDGFKACSKECAFEHWASVTS